AICSAKSTARTLIVMLRIANPLIPRTSRWVSGSHRSRVLAQRSRGHDRWCCRSPLAEKSGLSLVPRLAEECREQGAGGSGRGAGASRDLGCGGRQALGNGRGGAEMVEEAIADLRPQRGARLLGAPPPPDAGAFEGGTKARNIVPDFTDAGAFERRDRAHRDLPLQQ